jgi:plastocyanin domain-containing protein
MKRVLKLGLAALSLAGVSEASAAEPKAAKEPRTVHIAVTENGFEPTPVSVKKGEPLKLVITRKTDRTCAKAVVFDEPKLKKDLPLNQPVEVTFTPAKSGDLKYGCAMDKMLAGVLRVE